jgi:hypothetical protein
MLYILFQHPASLLLHPEYEVEPIHWEYRRLKPAHATRMVVLSSRAVITCVQRPVQGKDIMNFPVL